MRRIVVDTSALVDSANADREAWVETMRYLRGSHPLQGPVLLESEAGHIVHRKLPERFGDDPDARSESLNLLLYGVERVRPDDGSRSRCGRLVEAFDLTYYDAEFLELAARDEDGFLLTQDRRLLEAAHRHIGSARAADLDGAASRIAGGTL